MELWKSCLNSHVCQDINFLSRSSSDVIFPKLQSSKFRISSQDDDSKGQDLCLPVVVFHHEMHNTIKRKALEKPRNRILLSSEPNLLNCTFSHFYNCACLCVSPQWGLKWGCDEFRWRVSQQFSWQWRWRALLSSAPPPPKTPPTPPRLMHLPTCASTSPPPTPLPDVFNLLFNKLRC